MNKEQAEQVTSVLTKITSAVESINQPTYDLEQIFRPVIPEDSNEEMKPFADKFKELGVIETAKIAKSIYDLKNGLDTLKKIYENLNSMFTKNVLPELIEDEGLVSPVKVAGVAKLVVKSDIYVKRLDENDEAQAKFFEWLIGNGNGDIIKETINSSSLTSSVKSIMKKNNELMLANKGIDVSSIEGYIALPEEFLAVTPYQQVSFNKL